MSQIVLLHQQRNSNHISKFKNNSKAVFSITFLRNYVLVSSVAKSYYTLSTFKYSWFGELLACELNSDDRIKSCFQNVLESLPTIFIHKKVKVVVVP